jgi:hypothetical protein
MPSDKLLCPYSVIQSQRVWKKDRAISDPATIFIRDTGKDYSETEKLPGKGGKTFDGRSIDFFIP